MSDLVLKQIIFTRYLQRLLAQYTNIDIVFGEAWRSPETCHEYAREGKGVEHSCHIYRLAVDLIIHNEDGSVCNDKSIYEPLGTFWKSLPESVPQYARVTTCWGGDFTNLCDFYHFSIEHNGVK